MTPAEAAELLTIAAAFDRRTVGKADAIAWADALHGLRVEDCASAVRAHFAESTDWLMPATVRAGVKRVRAERIRAVPTSALEPADIDPNDVEAYQAARYGLVRSIADGNPAPEPKALPSRPVDALVKTAKDASDRKLADAVRLRGPS